MQTRHADRLEALLREHHRRREEGSARPEARGREHPRFRAEFSRAVREHVLPILEEAVHRLRPKVERAHLFHQLGTAGLRVKLDQWDDYERALVFFGDDRAGRVRVTHEGVGFSLLASELAVADLDDARAEAEVMRFLDRLLHGSADPDRYAA